MSILPLSLADIAAYIQIYDWEEDSDFFCKCIFALDDEYMKTNAEKMEAKRESERQQAEAKRRR